MKENVAPRNTYEFGMSLQTLLPNRLPDLDQTPSIYGPVVAIPIWNHSLQLRALYGAVGSLSLFIVEPAIRFNFATPFFQSYALVGGELFHYSLSGTPHEYWGGHVGAGLVFPMGDNYKWQLGTKIYILPRTLASFELSFCFLL